MPVREKPQLRQKKTSHSFYPPSQNTTGLPVDECQKNKFMLRRDVTPKTRRIIAASCLGVACRAKTEAEGEDGYFNGTTGLPVGIHWWGVFHF